MASSSNPDAGFKTFMTEIFPNKDIISIPARFYNHWKGRILKEAAQVMDPRGNAFDLEIDTFHEHFLYFSRGANQITKRYGLEEMHKAKFRYLGDNCFFLRVYQPDGTELKYPESESDTDDSADQDMESNSEAVEVVDVSSSEDAANPPEEREWARKIKKLNHLQPKPMLIPTRIVHKFYMGERNSITIVHEGGTMVNCKLLRYPRSNTECYIAGEAWFTFLKGSDLKRGDTLKFTVNDNPEMVMLEIVRS